MIQPTWHPTRKDLRVFGYVSLAAFGLLGALLRVQFGLPTLGWVIWGLGLYGAVAATLAPFRVYPLYLLVTVVTLPIGLVLSNVILGLIYFGLVTPLAWGLRLTGRDPLRLEKPQGATFWISRDAQPDPASYYRQS